MGKLPDPQIKEINVRKDYEYIENDRETFLNCLACLIDEIATKHK